MNRDRWAPIAAPVAVGSAAAAVAWLAFRLPPPSASDFDQFYVGARALAAGRDPYAAVLQAGLSYPLFYPLPAVLLALPLAWLPLEIARAVWSGLGAALLTVAARRYGRGLPVALVSAAFFNALVLGQWSPFLTAGAAVPALAATWVAKPSVGLAMFAAYPLRRALLGSIGLLVLSLAVAPSWPAHWLAAARGQIYLPPIMRPGGALLLLGLLRWRRPEGRLLAALAVVPQTTGLYETLPLFLIPRRRREAYALAILSLVAAFAAAHWFPWAGGSAEPLQANLARRWPLTLGLLYVPALILTVSGNPARRSPA